MGKSFQILLMTASIALLCACLGLDYVEPPPGIVIDVKSDSSVFAVIGDYGYAGEDEAAVAGMVTEWIPDFIITTGDNNYQYGDYSTLHENITQYYGDYIYNFDAPEEYQCRGKAFEDSINRFFPSPGNHDEAGARDLEPYLNFFTLPDEEEYYKFSWGPAAFYSINSLYSADHEKQQIWLEKALMNSTKDFNIVYFHHSPYSPGKHGDSEYMQWDFHHWGVDVVLSGHDHIYARMQLRGEDGLHYIINGLGGKSIYTCDEDQLDEEVLPVICYNENYGAMFCTMKPGKLILEFYSIDNPLVPIDRVEIIK